MKITKISLKNFHQFKDLEIDLTYPKGHPKKGEPLDKVCIIGQSGTGKTTLLKIIGGHTYTLPKLAEEYKIADFKDVRVHKRFNNVDVELRVGTNENSDNTYFWMNQTEDHQKIEFNDALEKQKEFLNNRKTQFIYFPADLHYEVNNEEERKNLLDKEIIDFSEFNLGDVWNLVLDEVKDYREQLLILKQKIADTAQKDAVNIKAIIAATKKLENWQKKTKNPVEKLAGECLDMLLKNFNLKVKTDFKFEKADKFKFIEVEDAEGSVIPQNLFSTGTKQVIFSATPLYLLKPEGALILFDEPERSLYPNIQKVIIDFYTSLAKNSQFFFATHSPIIASSFEPWEIIELKFDEKGKVKQELYYDAKKERHVDNYTIVPSYLTYDLMLNKVFDLKETYSTDRSEKITEVLMLRNQIKTYKEKGRLDTDAAKKVIEKYKNLAQKLFWDFEI